MLESTIGKILVIAYALFSIGTLFVVFLCGIDSCGQYIVLPIMPWAFIWSEDFGLGLAGAMYPIMVLLNTSVAYVIGASIEWMYHRQQDRKHAV